ncbi:type II CRISPR-associated endonuclease Cas1 [Staphylococcus simulans]
MSFRTVIITKESKLSLRMNHLIVKADELYKIPLQEISCLVIENPSVSITGHLLNALSENKIITLLCDKKHLPSSFVVPIYGHHKQSRHIAKQLNWKKEYKSLLWQRIIKNKITNQKQVIQYFYKNLDTSFFDNCIQETKANDSTNREGLAAKSYFNIILDSGVSRNSDEFVNAGLDYGYQVLLAIFVRTIVSKGYLTELGIKHKNEFNPFNLACDFMEVFRPLVDFLVLENVHDQFEKEEKRAILDMLNVKVKLNKKNYFLINVIEIYLDGIFKFLESGDENFIKMPVFNF